MEVLFSFHVCCYRPTLLALLSLCLRSLFSRLSHLACFRFVWQVVLDGPGVVYYAVLPLLTANISDLVSNETPAPDSESVRSASSIDSSQFAACGAAVVGVGRAADTTAVFDVLAG
jgi:hypothetical protein